MAERPPRRTAALLALGAALLLAACAAGLLAAPAGLGPRIEMQRAAWERQRIAHYRITARWTYGMIANGPWAVEVRDGQVVEVRDARTGRALGRTERALSQQNLTVPAIFRNLADEVRPSPANTPRYMLARTLAVFSPRLRDMLDRCAPRLPSVDYDPQLGYPTGITAHASPCYLASEWTVLVTELTPLP